MVGPERRRPLSRGRGPVLPFGTMLLQLRRRGLLHTAPNAYIRATMFPPKPSRSDTAKPAPRNGERLRWGLTGLGAIFLIVMVVAAGLKPLARDTDRDPKGESLAVLGVAPGAGPANPDRPATPPRP